jgi:parallel beta-helix repeat protein
VQIAVGSLATDNTVSGNVISGNGGAGVDVQANSNTIQGNDIGTDVSGKNALPNQAGVKVVGTGNTIGGTAAGTGNVISGNTADGIDISFATIQNGPSSTQNTTVQGNDIGVDAAGETVLGNGGSGVVITGQNDTSNLIGGTSRGARNVIAANKGQGIEIDDAGGDTIQGNYVGTDAAGATLLANGGAGIFLNGPHNTIGGTAAGAGNLIDGTGAAVYSGGVYVSTASAVTIASAGNTLQGNVIGTNASETAELSRFFYDVAVFGPSNAIGGTAPGAGNVITGGYGGVQVGGQENPILGNSIFGNSVTVSGKTISGGGIALLKGANGGEPAPVLAPVKDSRTSTTISGLVKPGMHRIEVFANPSCSDPEGKTLLGDVVTTKATWSLTIGKLPAGEGITATSTNTATSNTSPFSACRATPRG